jgi:hypothetical protein
VIHARSTSPTVANALRRSEQFRQRSRALSGSSDDPDSPGRSGAPRLLGELPTGWQPFVSSSGPNNFAALAPPMALPKRHILRSPTLPDLSAVLAPLRETRASAMTIAAAVEGVLEAFPGFDIPFVSPPQHTHRTSKHDDHHESVAGRSGGKRRRRRERKARPEDEEANATVRTLAFTDSEDALPKDSPSDAEQAAMNAVEWPSLPEATKPSDEELAPPVEGVGCFPDQDKTVGRSSVSAGASGTGRRGVWAVDSGDAAAVLFGGQSQPLPEGQAKGPVSDVALLNGAFPVRYGRASLDVVGRVADPRTDQAALLEGLPEEEEAFEHDKESDHNSNGTGDALFQVDLGEEKEFEPVPALPPPPPGTRAARGFSARSRSFGPLHSNVVLDKASWGPSDQGGTSPHRTPSLPSPQNPPPPEKPSPPVLPSNRAIDHLTGWVSLPAKSPAAGRSSSRGKRRRRSRQHLRDAGVDDVEAVLREERGRGSPSARGSARKKERPLAIEAQRLWGGRVCSDHGLQDGKLFSADDWKAAGMRRESRLTPDGGASPSWARKPTQSMLDPRYMSSVPVWSSLDLINEVMSGPSLGRAGMMANSPARLVDAVDDLVAQGFPSGPTVTATMVTASGGDLAPDGARRGDSVLIANRGRGRLTPPLVGSRLSLSPPPVLLGRAASAPLHEQSSPPRRRGASAGNSPTGSTELFPPHHESPLDFGRQSPEDQSRPWPTLPQGGVKAPTLSHESRWKVAPPPLLPLTERAASSSQPRSLRSESFASSGGGGSSHGSGGTPAGNSERRSTGSGGGRISLLKAAASDLHPYSPPLDASKSLATALSSSSNEGGMPQLGLTPSHDSFRVSSAAHTSFREVGQSPRSPTSPVHGRVSKPPLLEAASRPEEVRTPPRPPTLTDHPVAMTFPHEDASDALQVTLETFKGPSPPRDKVVRIVAPSSEGLSAAMSESPQASDTSDTDFAPRMLERGRSQEGTLARQNAIVDAVMAVLYPQLALHSHSWRVSHTIRQFLMAELSSLALEPWAVQEYAVGDQSGLQNWGSGSGDQSDDDDGNHDDTYDDTFDDEDEDEDDDVEGDAAAEKETARVVTVEAAAVPDPFQAASEVSLRSGSLAEQLVHSLSATDPAFTPPGSSEASDLSEQDCAKIASRRRRMRGGSFHSSDEDSGVGGEDDDPFADPFGSDAPLLVGTSVALGPGRTRSVSIASDTSVDSIASSDAVHSGTGTAAGRALLAGLAAGLGLPVPGQPLEPSWAEDLAAPPSGDESPVDITAPPPIATSTALGPGLGLGLDTQLHEDLDSASVFSANTALVGSETMSERGSVRGEGVAHHQATWGTMVSETKDVSRDAQASPEPSQSSLGLVPTPSFWQFFCKRVLPRWTWALLEDGTGMAAIRRGALEGAIRNLHMSRWWVARALAETSYDHLDTFLRHYGRSRRGEAAARQTGRTLPSERFTEDGSCLAELLAVHVDVLATEYATLNVESAPGHAEWLAGQAEMLTRAAISLARTRPILDNYFGSLATSVARLIGCRPATGITILRRLLSSWPRRDCSREVPWLRLTQATLLATPPPLVSGSTVYRPLYLQLLRCMSSDHQEVACCALDILSGSMNAMLHVVSDERLRTMAQVSLAANEDHWSDLVRSKSNLLFDALLDLQ